MRFFRLSARQSEQTKERVLCACLCGISQKYALWYQLGDCSLCFARLQAALRIVVFTTLFLWHRVFSQTSAMTVNILRTLNVSRRGVFPLSVKIMEWKCQIMLFENRFVFGLGFESDRLRKKDCRICFVNQDVAVV